MQSLLKLANNQLHSKNLDLRFLMEVARFSKSNKEADLYKLTNMIKNYIGSTSVVIYSIARKKFVYPDNFLNNMLENYIRNYSSQISITPNCINVEKFEDDQILFNTSDNIIIISNKGSSIPQYALDLLTTALNLSNYIKQTDKELLQA